MAKRDKDVITLGSGMIYAAEFTGDTMPTVDTLCVEENRLGYIKSGAALEYTEETYEEKDDLHRVSKVITTNENAVLKCGLITWNGKTLEKLVDRCKVTEEAGKRTIKLGGHGNAQGKYYAICFKHEDKKDGNLWVMIRGTNSAGLTLTFAVDAGTKIEPEFKAMPQDDAGTLITIVEETGAAA
jgi:hypothetical protein